MTERDSVPEILEALRNAPVGVSTPEEVDAERRDLLPWLEEQVADLPVQRLQLAQARKHRRAWVVGGATIFAAAAGAALVLQWQLLPNTEPASLQVAAGSEDYATLLSGRLSSGSVDLLPGSRLGAASVVRSSGDAPAVLQGSSGYVARLVPGGELALGAPGSQATRCELRLHRGEVQLSVPPLQEGTTLSVLTDDARVVVRGTEFSVALQEEAGASRTCVRVSSGAVEVHRRGAASALLHSGEQSGCGQPSETSASAEEGDGKGTRARPKTPARTPQQGPSSTLAEEGELLGAALAAEQSGDWARARGQLERLLQRYPHSPLARDARAALERVNRKQRAGAR